MHAAMTSLLRRLVFRNTSGKLVPRRIGARRLSFCGRRLLQVEQRFEPVASFPVVHAAAAARHYGINSGTAAETSEKRAGGEAGSVVEATATDVSVSPDGHTLTLGLQHPAADDDAAMKINATWLRHNCQCSACRQKSSGQKLIRPAQLAASYAVSFAELDAEGKVLCVEWNVEAGDDESHRRSEFTVEYLRRSRHTTPERRRALTTPTGGVGRLPSVNFSDVLENEGLFRWLQLLNEVGVCLVRGVPIDRDGYSVRRVAELICPVMNTIYGLTWDVVSDPRPINVAYSDAELDFHMDLAYYESPPGIQFLHCVQFDDCVAGGESLFVDAWLVAESMRVSHPEEFRVLTRVPATFQKIHFERDRPVFMRYRHPHITVEPEGGQIVGVRWAPAFEGPLDIDAADAYYRAYSTFARLLDGSPTRLETRLVAGDLVTFNNRRVLHARHGFELNGGARHLQGCYVNVDEYKSRLQVLAAGRSDSDALLAVKHVFNNSWL